MVGKETVDKLSYSICEQKHRTDDSELACVEHSAVEDRFLDHVKAGAAHIVKAIADGSGKEGLEAQHTELLFLKGWFYHGLRGFRNAVE